MTSNLFRSNERRDFFIWVDLRDHVNVQEFLNFKILMPFPISPDIVYSTIRPQSRTIFADSFISNLVSKLILECDLEETRKKSFRDYPSRLTSRFILDSLQDAKTYYEINKKFLDTRRLFKLQTVDKYVYSIHDEGHIQLWHAIIHPLNSQSYQQRLMDYWKGQSVGETCFRNGLNQIIQADSINEILFDGKLKVLSEIDMNAL